jgi:hypothetical protein
MTKSPGQAVGNTQGAAIDHFGHYVPEERPA